MTDKSISFTHEGETFTGIFRYSEGFVYEYWLLVVDNDYMGKLRAQAGEWVFEATPQFPWAQEYVKIFGEAILEPIGGEELLPGTNFPKRLYRKSGTCYARLPEHSLYYTMVNT